MRVSAIDGVRHGGSHRSFKGRLQVIYTEAAGVYKTNILKLEHFAYVIETLKKVFGPFSIHHEHFLLVCRRHTSSVLCTSS